MLTTRAHGSAGTWSSGASAGCREGPRHSIAPPKKKKAQPGLSPLLLLPVPSLLNFTLFNEDAQLCSAIAGCWHSPKHAHRAEKVSAPSGVVQRGPGDAHQLHVRHPLSTLSTAQGGVP